ncbi:NACHT domain-containing protein [Saccharothrix variisporea]|uniref:NACHT domain-containing protein n=1 Tax=Saccharothrix variisporea TaxID=543527 RepID=A0A495X2G0_9PSEU|nr:NACHT domain-containing protein [Saccharothrix variisporea]RKT68160.1 NACHT domain-containing protein [Saccharothrix variisporea]
MDQEIANHVTGGVHAPTVQAGVIQGGVHFHVPVAPPPDDGLLPAAVRSLLHAQVSAAHELPYQLRGARRPSLATVYVRQDLGAGVEEPRTEAPRPTPIVDGHGQLVEVPRAPVVRVAVRPPARTVREALDGDDHLLVTGGAGQGKSTLSLRLAADLAGWWCGTGENPITEEVVPLRLPARELAGRLDLPFSQALADSAHAEYGALLRAPVTADLLAERVAGRRWLLLVDALDEVADSADRDRLVTVLASWAGGDAPYRVMVTTRPVDGGALAPLHRIGAARYELQPFDDQALLSFAHNWFADDDPDLAHRFVRQIRAAHLDELVRVPLLATIAAIIFEQRSDRPLPDNQYELYESYLAFLRSARTPTGPFEDHREALLEHLGRIRLETDSSLLDAARDWVRTNVAARALPPDWPDALTAFLVSVGPLIIRTGDLRFLHHSFAEHLAATSIARDLPAAFDPEHPEFVRTLYAARPRERGHFARSVLLHHTHLRPTEADPLISRLHAGDAEHHLLAARLLARRVPASASVVDAFLETVWGWAMTSLYPCAEILAQASRATHHPGLSDWLTRLMRTDSAPPDSRIEAASALATRLRGDRTPEAVAFLTALVDDPDASVGERLDAAQALADCGETERAAAERGLRAVLENPLASGYRCRTAAVILSAFGRGARTDAVEALTRLVDDGTTPPADLVEAATGLVEIGAEFHERGAEVFRAILTDPVNSTAGRRDAALGLASLGPDHNAEAATALTALSRDHRRSGYDRAHFAGVLAELGQEHRRAAADLVVAALANPFLTPNDRLHWAKQLGGLGVRRREQAAAHLRAVIADGATTVSVARSAAEALNDLGPEHVAESAAELLRLATAPEMTEGDRIWIWGRLTEYAEPYRSEALRELRWRLTASGLAEENRCTVAERLVRAGPEFHEEAKRCLLAIVRTAINSGTVLRAWSALVDLDSELREEALAVFEDTVRRSGYGQMFHAAGLPSSDEEHDRVARVLFGVLADDSASFRSRLAAIYPLLQLGRSHHPAVVDLVCAMIRSVAETSFDFLYLARTLAYVGVALRARVADVLCELVPRAVASAVATRMVAALDVLGFGDRPEAVAALRGVLADGSADRYTRADAAVLLARCVPGEADELAAAVFEPADRENNPVGLRQRVAKLAGTGADVVPLLRASYADPDTPQWLRVSAAGLLHDLGAEGGLDELRRLAGDEHLSAPDRCTALIEVARRDPAGVEAVRAYFRAVAVDGHELLDERAFVAHLMAHFESEHVPSALALLRSGAADRSARPVERARCVERLRSLFVAEEAEVERLAVEALTHPSVRRRAHRLVGPLERPRRTEVERDLLADRSLSLAVRVPRPDLWDDLPLAPEAEAEIRDVLAGPETSAGERVDAATELAGLSGRFLPEATRLLSGMGSRKARKALAGLGAAQWRQVVAQAEREVFDGSLSLRERVETALMVAEVARVLPESVAGFLREAVTGVSDVQRVRIRFALRKTDGLGPVRVMRDDAGLASAVRWQAAVKLVPYDVADRAAAVSLLHAIATDPAEKPALRRRVAHDLARLGAPGREKAVAVLRAMATGEDVPVAIRIRAAFELLDSAPAWRREAMALLKGFRDTARPILRARARVGVGRLEPAEAAVELAVMAVDPGLPANVRVRSAVDVVGLWPPLREKAVVAVRAVARDEGVARHVRRRAARDLARWSEVCREEARGLVRELDVRGDDDRGGRDPSQ